MTEIEKKSVLEGMIEPTRHEVIDARLDTLEKRLAENITLAISNQWLIASLSETQIELFKLMERYFGTPDGV